MLPEYELTEPFHIDHGELDGLSHQVIFCIGVEYQMIRQSLEHGEVFERTMHVENKDRVAILLDNRNRKYRFTFMQDDPSEGWVHLTVQAEENAT